MEYYEALPEYDLKVFARKYAYFTANQMGGRFDWNGASIVDVHKNIGKDNRQCPFNVKKL